MRQNDASRITRAIDLRVTKAVKSGAFVEYTLGTVTAVTAKTASVLLYGETDPAYASEGFRLPGPIRPSVGDKVIVAMDKNRGDRWVREVIQSTSYSTVYISTDGKLWFGDGTAAANVSLYRKADGLLYYKDASGVEHGVGGGGSSSGGVSRSFAFFMG